MKIFLLLSIYFFYIYTHIQIYINVYRLSCPLAAEPLLYIHSRLSIIYFYCFCRHCWYHLIGGVPECGVSVRGVCCVHCPAALGISKTAPCLHRQHVREGYHAFYDNSIRNLITILMY